MLPTIYAVGDPSGFPRGGRDCESVAAGLDRGRIKRRRKQALKNRTGSLPGFMQAVLSAARCIWCDARLNVEDWMEMAYQSCRSCLYPLPTD